MSQHHEIVPGRSIGPFRIGMARNEVEELGIGPGVDFADRTGTYYALVGSGEETSRRETSGFPEPGVHVHYGPDGRCHRLQAVFSYWPVDPVFTLRGRIVNGMSGTEVKAILRSLASDVHHFYGSIESRAAGIRATKWEAGDEPIMSVTVQPPDPADA